MSGARSGILCGNLQDSQNSSGRKRLLEVRQARLRTNARATCWEHLLGGWCPTLFQLGHQSVKLGATSRYRQMPRSVLGTAKRTPPRVASRPSVSPWCPPRPREGNCTRARARQKSRRFLAVALEAIALMPTTSKECTNLGDADWERGYDMYT